MHGYLKDLFKDLDFKMENQGKKLVITVNGDEEKLKTVEKKFNALKELCDCGEDCCCNCK
jgi:hypothetical protein